MSKTSLTSPFCNYVAECVRLLYWAYFKPFTFERWLCNIHPELKLKDNPFDKQAEFHTNPRLRRYAGQVWWLTVLASTFPLLLIAPVYTSVSGELFNWWFPGSIFWLGWLIGKVLNLSANRNISENNTSIHNIYTISIVGWIVLLAIRFLSGVVQDLVLVLAFGVAVGLLTVSLEEGLAQSVAGGVVLGVLLSVTGGMLFAILGGVEVGVKIEMAVLMAFGIGMFTAVGVMFVFSVLRACFWLSELLWTFILFFISRFQKQVSYLQYLPPYFDELIILPLPFIDRMIIEAYQENPDTACETIDYLITKSTNQQQVAIQAIIKITIDSLSQCRRLGDIADIAYQLNWIPSPPPKELGTVLLQFLDISQDVRSSQEATSLYHQHELLKSPISALQELKKTLAFVQNAPLATKFGSIAERWLTTLETAQRTLEDTTRQSQEIKQVYIAGNSLDPATAKNRFKGRIDIFREIETLTLSDQPPVLLLYGGRRTGKTSALKYLPYRIGANIIPLLLDLQGAASATTLKGLAENIAQQIIEAARRLPRKLHLPNPDTYRLAEDPFPALQTWLTEIERSNFGKRFLLCLDEFERLSEVVEATNSRAPLNFIRNLSQHQQKWILLFSGSHQLSELDAYWSDYLINTRALRMSYLQESEARELILQPIEDFPNIYESSAVDMIIQLTHCQPYLVQLVCYELVELLNRDIRANRREADTTTATAQDVQKIIPIVLERGDQYFRELWTSIADSDRNLLRRIIQGETPTQQDKGIMRKLARKEILTQEGIAFQVPLVQKFVEQLLEEE